MSSISMAMGEITSESIPHNFSVRLLSGKSGLISVSILSAICLAVAGSICLMRRSVGSSLQAEKEAIDNKRIAKVLVELFMFIRIALNCQDHISATWPGIWRLAIYDL